MPSNSSSQTYASTEPESSPGNLTCEKFAALIESVPKIEFAAFTVTPACWNQLCDAVEHPSEGSLFQLALTAPLLYMVHQQSKDCIKWTNKDALDTYLEMMGEREVKQLERRSALAILTPLAKFSYGELVLNTMNIPTHRLVEMVKLIEIAEPVRPELPIISADAFEKLLADVFPKDEGKRKRKSKPVEPFYSKFTRRKR